MQIYKRRQIYLLIITAILSILLVIPTNTSVNAQSTPGTRFGVGVEAPNYYSTTAQYIDLIYASGPWGPGWQSTVNSYTADGYPASISGTSFTLDQQAGYPAGAYQYYATGSFDVYMNATNNPNLASRATIDGHQYAGFVPGSVKVNYTPQGTRVTTGLVQLNMPQTPINGTFTGINTGWDMLLTISNLDPNDLPDNMHLIRPDYDPWPATQNDAGYPFGKEFLKSLAPFCAIRFIAMAFNNNITDWSTRSNPNYFGTQAAQSIENMIKLANVTGCDMWVNLPFNATRDFDTNFAQLIKNNLNSNLHCHYEISDELWNWGGLPYWTNWNTVDQMAQNNTPPPGLPSYYSAGAWEMHGEAMGSVLMQHALNIQPILGSMGRPMLCGFMLDATDYAGGGLKYIQQQMGLTPSNVIYGIAGAPYFTGSGADLDSIFQSMNINQTTTIATALTQQMALANQYGLKFCCYEFGQTLYPTSSTFDLYQSAQTDSRMGTCYQTAATQLQNAGADLCNFYAFCEPDSSYGYWGLMQSMQSLSNPPIKYATAAAIGASCNCGNSPDTAPPPPPASTPAPLSVPVPAPPPAPSPPPMVIPSPAPSSSSLGGHWGQSAIYGHYWIWDNPKDSPMTPHH